MGVEGETGSVARVRAALRAAGHPEVILAFPEGTRTAAAAAAAIGCEVAAIAKSIIFRGEGDQPVLVVASGAVRVDAARAAAALGIALGRADAAWVRAVTGFAIGGVAPIGHLTRPRTLIDAGLFALPRLWAAAGSPAEVFETTAPALLALTGGEVAIIAED